METCQAFSFCGNKAITVCFVGLFMDASMLDLCKIFEAVEGIRLVPALKQECQN